MMKRRLLAGTIAVLLSTGAWGQAQSGGDRLDDAAGETGGQHRGHDAARLDAVIVTASPLSPDSEDLVQPVEVLTDEELDRRKGATLGETVARELGVQSSYFGPGVGRPIIRGLEGARVQVLQSGLGALDASTVSADHAVAIEPFLADQIEILKGPATLLYGSGAIGGAVNVVDGRVPERLPEGIQGRAELRGNSVSDETTGMARIDLGSGRFALHADAFHRDTSDYEIPGHAELEDAHAHGAGEHEHEEALEGVLENSAIRTSGGALGGSWIGDTGFLGLAVSTYSTLYGVPGHAHAEADDEHEEDDGHDHEEGQHDEEAVRIDLDQQRIDARGAWYTPWTLVEKLNVRAGKTSYRHLELEGGEIGTRFDSSGVEARVEAVHAPLAGWRGALGLQLGERDFRAAGEEAFVPASVTDSGGLFLIEERDGERWKLEAGARIDDVSVEPEGALRGRDFTAASASFGALWRASEALHVSLGLDRAERAPTAEELYSNGAHIATRSFELGDPALRTETANQLELAAHLHVGPLEARAAVYDNRFDDFIYLAATAEEADGLPVRAWTQADARFRGIEAEAELQLADNASGAWQLRLFGDRVRGTLDAGGALPRIAPARVGADLGWERDGWRASLGAVRHGRQDRVAALEEPTAGYTLVDAHLAYHWDAAGAGWEAFVDATNLTDQEARVHTSFLRDVAPLPGRGIAIGIRAWF